LEFLTAIIYAFHLFLDLVGLTKYSTFSTILFGIGQNIGVVVPVVYVTEIGEDAIIYVAMLRTLIAATHCCVMFFAMCTVWLDVGYIRGIFDIPLRVRIYYDFDNGERHGSTPRLPA
jgi:hypothetical protein